MLRVIPYRGTLAFQLPDHAVPWACGLAAPPSGMAARPVDAPPPGGAVGGGEVGGLGWKWAEFDFRQVGGVRWCDVAWFVYCVGSGDPEPHIAVSVILTIKRH